MGSSSSKPPKNEALHLCKQRMRFIRQATESRYALSAVHLAYIQSLRNVGSALRRFAEAEGLTESSLSTSEPDKSPSHSSFVASPSPSHVVETTNSPLQRNSSPISPRPSNSSYMRASGSSTITVKIDSSLSHFVDDESLTIPLPPPPPPPPPPEVGSSWDFFTPADSIEDTGLPHACHPNLSNLTGSRKFREEEVVVPIDEADVNWEKVRQSETKGKPDDPENPTKVIGRSVTTNSLSLNNSTSEKSTDARPSEIGEESRLVHNHTGTNESESLYDVISSQQCISKVDKSEPEKELCPEREDPSEFITHRAKDFLSSIKDIEHRFFRAAESASEVARMLEANKIRLGSYLEKKGRSTPFLSSIHLSCCRRGVVLDHEPTQHVTKVITWNRSISSMSLSSKTPLTTAIKDDCDSGSDFIEEFCMISGSHSSTLDRLYAWEKKLYDEVKASESIRKEYDRKCCQLRHQFARDLNPKVIDRTRAIIKDLYSQVRVAIQAVDSISKQIEKLRDEELLPQLFELIQGLIRMWKAMLARHHSQYITISLAYHVKNSAVAPRTDAYRQVLIDLQNEIECFTSSFTMWVDAQIVYVEALDSWLQNCILQPQGRLRGRKTAFSPRRVLAPPIFVLCRDWAAGIKSLPSEDISKATKCVVSELNASVPQQVEKNQTEQNSDELNTVKEKDDRCQEGPNMGNLQAGLMKTFDCMTKFAEASLKMYEDVKQATEVARISYTNGCRMRFLI